MLGDRGHLSNAQAADLLREVVKRSPAGRLQHLVQLHLSRQCNRPAMAADAARVALAELQAAVRVHTARQHEVGPSLTVGGALAAVKRRVLERRERKKTESAVNGQPLLPGWEESA